MERPSLFSGEFLKGVFPGNASVVTKMKQAMLKEDHQENVCNTLTAVQEIHVEKQACDSEIGNTKGAAETHITG